MILLRMDLGSKVLPVEQSVRKRAKRAMIASQRTRRFARQKAAFQDDNRKPAARAFLWPPAIWTNATNGAKS
jgi:uncharacterized protein (DUF3084 family)